MAAPSNILLIRPSALGDVCRTVPVLASLRRAYPEARIDWLVQDSFVDAVWHHPALSNTLPFPRKQLGWDLKRGRLGRVLAWIRKLRTPGYDLVIDAQGLLRSGVLMRLTGASLRVGHADARELGWLGANRRIKAPAAMHTVDRMLALLEGIGIEPVRNMRLYTGVHERAWVRAQARLREAIHHRGYVVLAPTSRWPAKRWPAERFAVLAAALLDGSGGDGGRGVDAVAVVGGPGEQDQCGPLLELAARDPRVIDLVGRTSVGQLMALVQASSLVVANDSAALHMAVGFDRPCLGLYGPTRVDLVGPYAGGGREAARRDMEESGEDRRRVPVVIQHREPGDRLDHKAKMPEGGGMMKRISAEEVIAAARKLLDESTESGAAP